MTSAARRQSRPLVRPSVRPSVRRAPVEERRGIGQGTSSKTCKCLYEPITVHWPSVPVSIDPAEQQSAATITTTTAISGAGHRLVV